ncbi:LINE-1 retrotransposable element ORF2 protein [Cucumis melo var. makuwa]|uniref:LINE-1 retrotransposable element ORF2 protein n=1 Tax=Cucumis melo var. makuwa TaxID=1194695 RepID=A0A5A7TQI1_CUCMM|nr:LINE-1 retrotransposable element ORF2 protein [Cucumis melo var. makuwa]TYK23599.1 LINE-1 retrotransposable element ORF2 protein [Cucumis melo var. makuwa]
MLNNFITNNLLIDPPLINNRFTWSNLRNPPTFFRIDRFLYNSTWENLFSPHTTRTLPRSTSDHFPLVCEDSNPKLSWGPVPFRLNSIALSDPEFKRNMGRWWENSIQDGHPGFSFIQRLKSLANFIKPWQKEKLHSLTYAKDNIIREVESIDKKEVDTPLTQEESNRRLALKADLSELSLKESQFWYQRAKKLWLREGDENSSFFHRICSSRQKRSFIHEIQDEVDGKKTPGPDGFPISFKSYWYLLKEDIMDIFKDFYDKGVINKNMNNTYIALIPKKKDYSHPKDFRPISLTTSIYKIIAKTLSNRLKTTLPDTISGNQLAFVKNRQITDAILMANEAVDFWKVKKIKGFILKLDIEKAFDNLNWDFIDIPQGRIKANRGLRQGDPLSPFLFVIAMDYLSRLLSHLESSGAIKGVSLNSNCNISHILFADDILLFIEDNDYFLNNLRMALSLFERASGLKINLLKSALVPVNVSVNRAKECASFWGISCHSLPLSYLGVPLGGNPKSNLFWRNVEDKIQKKLNNWKYAQISKSGRLTLIKSTLSSLPIYQLSVFQAPSLTCKNIEKSWRKFLWKGNNGSEGSHLINWTKVSKSKEEGRLGISRLHVTNKALLTKWLWRYLSEPNALWRRLIQCKYKGNYPGDIPSNISSSTPKAPWRSIIDNIDWFKSNQSWELNNGDQISFWYSNWSLEGRLSTAYPRLFALTLDKEISVKDAWNTFDNRWNIIFRRELNDRERSKWAKILEILPTPRSNRGSSKLTWNPDSNNSFSIASAKALISRQLDQSPGDPRAKLLEIIWKSTIPMKIKFFMWCLIQRRINTMEVIQQRMPNIPLQPNCILSISLSVPTNWRTCSPSSIL